MSRRSTTRTATLSLVPIESAVSTRSCAAASTFAARSTTGTTSPGSSTSVMPSLEITRYLSSSVTRSRRTSGSAVTHRFKLRSPKPLLTASWPCSLATSRWITTPPSSSMRCLSLGTSGRCATLTSTTSPSRLHTVPPPSPAVAKKISFPRTSATRAVLPASSSIRFCVACSHHSLSVRRNASRSASSTGSPLTSSSSRLLPKCSHAQSAAPTPPCPSKIANRWPLVPWAALILRATHRSSM
mmetsp:Transcript_12253/g.28664  ORF Transcript_12253/g.28664 Transcript_12253/m.28664 type:complete len:242 (-) Transcript_12253:1206-1931(-)